MATAWVQQARTRQAAFRRRGDEGGQRMAWEAWQRYGEWFEQLPWDWFATFTIRPAPHVTAEFALRLHRRWAASVQRECGRQLRQVVAVERHQSGYPHLHALVYGVGGFDQFRGMTLWEHTSGGSYARIYPYSGQGGAASYCAKYVTKGGDVYLLGPWPKVPGRAGQLQRDVGANLGSLKEHRLPLDDLEP